MPNAIDIYQPRYMAEVVRQTPPIPTYFRDTFFNRVITFPTERVDMDLMKGDRKILPYVHPDAGGKAVKMDGFQTKSYAAPLVSGYIVTTAAQMMTRLPGEDLYSGMTPAERAARKLMEEYATLNDACTRREEYMCAEAIKTGLIHVEGPGVKEDIDFDFTNTVSLTGDEQWGGSKAAILNNLEDWVSRVLIEGFANVDTAIMGKTALRKFLDDADVMKKLDNRRVELGIIAPRELPGGVSYIGHLNKPNLDIMQYAGVYLDDWTDPANPTVKPLVDDNMIILISSAASFIMAYGACNYYDESKQLVTAQTSRLMHSYIDHNPERRILQLDARPLPIPDKVDSWLVATVC